MVANLTIDLTFRLQQTELPSVEEQYGMLWKFAQSLQEVGLPLDDWYPPASTPALSLQNKAFDQSGPTTSAIDAARAETCPYPDVRSLGVWNGIESAGGVVFTGLLGAGSLCSLRLRAKGVAGFMNVRTTAGVVSDAACIWSASTVQVGSFKYFSLHKVFEKRPGAGWMLYLPTVLTEAQVPEARDLIPVMEGGLQKGTIIVSVIDEPFSTDDPEHVKIANSSEVRLADRGLLPLFAEL